jgi:hypothetical protein
MGWAFTLNLLQYIFAGIGLWQLFLQAFALALALIILAYAIGGLAESYKESESAKNTTT